MTPQRRSAGDMDSSAERKTIAGADLIGGSWVPLEGSSLQSRNPAAPDDVVWSGTPVDSHVDDAVRAARAATAGWGGRALEDRAAVLRRWQEVTTARADELARLMTREMGKTLAESVLEAKLLGEKVAITLDPVSMSRVTPYTVAGAGRSGACRFKPFGVMAVIGPFNFPAHLPNGHWVPALLLGNTVVFKPSEKTPGVGQLLGELALQAGFPPGVFNVVQGAASTAQRLTSHPDVDGILFTGSWPVGRRILEANIERPGRIIALEMGGSNPVIVAGDASLRHAVIECVRAAFATTGQRCTCARRFIVHAEIADRFIGAFCKAASTLMIGPGDAQEPIFMGPLVTEAAAAAALDFQRERVARGASVLLQATRMDRPGWFLTPGVVQVERFTRESDSECFGPISQISVYRELDDAIEQANESDFGLAASIFTRSDATWERAFQGIRAGCINRNCGTAGASSKLPFGGLGRSGNLRPAAAFSVDYCAYPVASMRVLTEETAPPPGMLVDHRWFA